MGIVLKTHKMLWGRSGNMCAFPDCKKQLVMDISEIDDISIVGEEAHIVSREDDGPRGTSQLTPEQRDMYSNLVLMCSIHHKIIDDHPETYPVKLLHEYKTNHETWVKQNLNLDNVKQREDETYAAYIDEFERLADVKNWKGWTSYLLGSGQPSISSVQYDNLHELTQYLISRVWYKRYPELERAFYNFKNISNDLLKVFDKYRSEKNNGLLWTSKFYHIDEWNPKLYDKLAKEYDYHVDLVLDLTLELTRAANHIFDKVREFIFPSFRIKEGLLLVESGPFMDLSWKINRVEYKTENERKNLYPGLREFMKIRSSRDMAYGRDVSENYFFPTF